MTRIDPRKRPLKVSMGNRSGSTRFLPVGRSSVSVRSARIPSLVRWSFLAFVATVSLEYFQPLVLVSGSFTLARAAGLLLVASCCLYPRRFFSFPPGALLLFLGYTLVYALNSLTFSEGLVTGTGSELFRLTQLLVLFWIASTVLKEENLAKNAMLIFSLGTVFLSISTMLDNSWSSTIQGGTRMTVEGFNPNYLAYIAALAGVTVIGLQMSKSVRTLWHKIFLVAMTLLFLVVVVSTGSRGGILSLLIGLSVYFLPFVRARRRTIVIVWGIFAAATLVLLALANPDTSSRLQDISEMGLNLPRGPIYREAITMITERPLLGWSLEAEYELGRRLGLTRRRNAHNLYLHVLLQVGLLGALFFFAAVWLCIRAAWKSRLGSLGLLPMALIITVLAGNIAHEYLTRKPTWLIFALALAAATNHTRTRSKLRRVW